MAGDSRLKIFVIYRAAKAIALGHVAWGEALDLKRLKRFMDYNRIIEHTANCQITLRAVSSRRAKMMIKMLKLWSTTSMLTHYIICCPGSATSRAVVGTGGQTATASESWQVGKNL
jgi:hypothetical protein